MPRVKKGCELLSNFGYIGIGNNFARNGLQEPVVVNCFQILAILGLETTDALRELVPHTL